MTDTYETHAKGIRILPGQWRPHYPFEQIAWVSPPWPSQDYVWLDFPEAIFTDAGLLYLSHVNPRFPALFPDLPKVAWRQTESSIVFERVLPNGVRFGGSVQRAGDGDTVALSLFLVNGGDRPLRRIKLQTCAYLRGIEEFGEHTMDNKYVHVPGQGWLTYNAARAIAAPPAGRFALGWRSGPLVANLPVIIARSSETQRLVAMTWREHTLSLVGNPQHPCLHADPVFPDLDPGQDAQISGELIFSDKELDAFAAWFMERYRDRPQESASGAWGVR